MLRIGDMGLCASSRLASLGLRAICGLMFSAVGFLADSTAFPQGILTQNDPVVQLSPVMFISIYLIVTYNCI